MTYSKQMKTNSIIACKSDLVFIFFIIVIIQRPRVRRWACFVIKYILISPAVNNIFMAFSFSPTKSAITL